MSDFTLQQARNRIDATITTNGSGSITGKILNEAFNGVIDALNTIYTKQDGDNWYGIIWTFDASGNSTVTRIGNPMLHVSLPVQTLMKGCVLNSDGTVNYYLNPSDWSKKADDTASNLTGTDGDVMVEIPGFYYKYDELYNGFLKRLRISLYEIDSTWNYSPKFYIGAYKGYISSSKLVSVTGQKATVNTSLPSFRTAARAKVSNNTNWNVITYSMRKAIWMLFITEYATLNSQDNFTSATTDDGYKQGGLGLGVTQGVVTSGVYNLCTTGYTNAQGNFSIGGESFTDGGSNKNCRYRGIENPFGEVWEWTDGVYVNNYTAYEIVDKSNFTKLGDSSYTGDASSECRQIGTVSSTSSGVAIKTILGGAKCDILPSVTGDAIPSTAGENYDKYYCDGWWINSGFRGFPFGGRAGSGARAGLVSVTADRAPSNTSALIGSRLAYIPD